MIRNQDHTSDKKTGPTVQIIVFKLGGEEYALEIDQIKEVVPTPTIAKVPLTPNYVKGVANIRGNILAIIDLEEKFELKETQDITQTPKYTLVVENEAFNMAILVNDVPNTLTVPVDEIDHSPSIIQEDSGEKNYIKGIVKLEKRLIILIDLYSIIMKSDVQAALIAS